MGRVRFSRPTYSLTLTAGAGANTVSTAASLNGLLSQIQVTTPATVDGAATITVNIIDSDSYTVYTKATIAANTKDRTLLTGDLKVPLCDSYTIQVVFSANQTVTTTTTKVILLLDKGA